MRNLILTFNFRYLILNETFNFNIDFQCFQFCSFRQYSFILIVNFNLSFSVSFHRFQEEFTNTLKNNFFKKCTFSPLIKNILITSIVIAYISYQLFYHLPGKLFTIYLFLLPFLFLFLSSFSFLGSETFFRTI